MKFFFKKKCAKNKTAVESMNLISCAKRVLLYREHLIEPIAVKEIRQSMIAIADLLEAEDWPTLKQEKEKLNQLLRKHGGDIFPIKTLNDSVETFFVAALLAIVIRTFFVQSFKIPTNSMYPTYHGEIHRLVHPLEHKWPIWKKSLHKIFFFGKSFKIIAQNDGEISIPLVQVTFEGSKKTTEIISYKLVSVSHIKKKRQYTIFVDSKPHTILVPENFSLDKAFLEKFCAETDSWPKQSASDSNLGHRLYKTKKFIKQGQTVIDFEILPGDMLFVDKMTTHFREPKIGESIIFNTENAQNIKGKPKFFIKRLVAQGGNKVKISDKKLLIDGQELKVFNNLRGCQNEYIADGILANGQEITVPKEEIFVLGDNSANSYDSRFWGFLPQKAVCGRPLFIFAPLYRMQLCK